MFMETENRWVVPEAGGGGRDGGGGTQEGSQMVQTSSCKINKPWDSKVQHSNCS